MPEIDIIEAQVGNADLGGRILRGSRREHLLRERLRMTGPGSGPVNLRSGLAVLMVCAPE
ncbi:hypothetical protein [Rhodoplanes azumiensis]|uniref:Urease accessory protein UreD n=1 Tax=Rhodoplanes azumiensis TaxID=1897628 RepID=A0ABW5AEB2_9BRAD